MESPIPPPQPLIAREIHGFNTTADLNMEKFMEDAAKRWFRPNELHAILSNHTLFKIQPQPVDRPPSGSLLLFDRKMLRNFRKDGHNWKKKKDGKTVQEAHEKLKIGNEEKIHVYYARNEDDPNFYRRCYWLLDKELERIVLVHYLQASEENANQLLPIPIEPKEVLYSTSPLRSSNASNHSELSSSLFEEINSSAANVFQAGFQTSTDKNPEFSLAGLDSLCWEDIMEQPSCVNLSARRNGDISSSAQQTEYQFTGSRNQDGFLKTSLFGHPDSMLMHNSSRDVKQSGISRSTMMDDQKDSQILRIDNIAGDVKNVRMASEGGISTDTAYIGDVLQTQYSFGNWADTLDGSLDLFRAPQPVNKASGDFTRNELPMEIQSSSQARVFDIVEISPAYASHTEETKIIVVGNWRDSHKYLEISTIACNIGDKIVPLELVQTGVYRTVALPHPPGSVSLYMTSDGYTPISQVISFEYRSAVSNPPNKGMSSAESDSPMPKEMEFGILTRLSHLLFTTTNSVSVMSSRISPNSMKEAKKFQSFMSSFFENQWKHFIDTSGSAENSLANHSLFELFLKDKLKEWIFLRIAEGCKAAPRDSQGQGVIHLCAMLDYAWAIRLFSLSNLTLDFRDSRGWTPLHWAAYYGREKTVAALLSAGANPCLVTDPTPDFSGGCIPADLSSQAGFEGLAAYLAEKGLGAHIQAMALSGNIDSSLLQHQTNSGMDPPNLSEQELCLKDSLAAYRNAAEAADRIQTAFRERSLKQQMKVAQQTKPEDEAASIVAALKIQKAFRNHSRRKMMKAAARIQGTFRTLQARKNFLRLRQKVIKIQAIFRGHLERRQYRKICWSVGIFEKAVLRWRLKRKGLRGLHAETSNISQPMEEDNCVEEDFFRVSREQAEERVRRSVVRVQAMFRSYQAQQEYRRMKMAYNEAKLEYPVSSADW